MSLKDSQSKGQFIQYKRHDFQWFFPKFLNRPYAQRSAHIHVQGHLLSAICGVKTCTNEMDSHKKRQKWYMHIVRRCVNTCTILLCAFLTPKMETAEACASMLCVLQWVYRNAFSTPCSIQSTVSTWSAGRGGDGSEDLSLNWTSFNKRLSNGDTLNSWWVKQEDDNGVTRFNNV